MYLDEGCTQIYTTSLWCRACVFMIISCCQLFRYVRYVQRYRVEIQTWYPMTSRSTCRWSTGYAVDCLSRLRLREAELGDRWLGVLAVDDLVTSLRPLTLILIPHQPHRLFLENQWTQSQVNLLVSLLYVAVVLHAVHITLELLPRCYVT